MIQVGNAEGQHAKNRQATAEASEMRRQLEQRLGEADTALARVEVSIHANTYAPTRAQGWTHTCTMRQADARRADTAALGSVRNVEGRVGIVEGRVAAMAAEAAQACRH